MSTQIYDAHIIKTTNMGALIKIAQKIQKMEMKYLTEDLAAYYQSVFSKDFKEFLSKEGLFNFSREMHHNFQIYLGMSRGSSGTFGACYDFVSNSVLQAIKKRYPKISDEDADTLLYLLDDVSNNRSLNFIHTEEGFTIVKWHSLTERTKKWLDNYFQEYTFQNSTDGPSLKKLNPKMAENINAALEELKAEYLKEEDFAIIDKTKEAIAYDLAFHEYRLRETVWGQAIGGCTNFSECSLSFDPFSDFRNSMKLVQQVLRGVLTQKNHSTEALEYAKKRLKFDIRVAARIKK